MLDGLPDRWHSEHWNQLVEDFFPLEVSQLFFFDAEKIRSLAEDETSSQVLGSAVKSLLGPRHRRASDRRRRCRGSKAGEGSWRPPSRERTAPTSRTGSSSSQAELDALRTKRSELENIRRRTEAEVQRLEEEFKAAGGKHWEARGDRKRRQEELKKEVNECESRLVALAATELPLCLLDDLLERVKRQDERERLAAEVEVVRQILVGAGRSTCWRLLAEVKAPPAIVRKVKKHLADDRQSRALTRSRDRFPAVAHGRRPVAAPPSAQPEAGRASPRSRDPARATVAARSRDQGRRTRAVDHAGGRGDRRVSQARSARRPSA